jgi:hypothetical protein
MPREVGLGVEMAQSYFGNLIKQKSLTSFEKEVITGCLLGDGTLTKAGKNFRLRIEHALAAKKYIEWKFQLLRRLCVSDVQYVSSHGSYRFGTVGHPEITELRQIWYCPVKQVPADLELTPLMLAIWFMDDGTKHRDTVDISVHSFSDASIKCLRDQIAKFGIETTVNYDGKGKRLYVLKRSYLNFKELTKSYIVECMARKWP